MTELLTLGRVRLLAGAATRSMPPGQPKRIALLAYLAVNAGRPGRRRDELLATFWPELGDEEARRALRQALHYLRRVLGADVLITEGDEVTIRDGALQCDAVTFEEMAAAGKPDEALALYAGDFLQGFYVPDVSSEFEEWVDRTRARLRRRAAAVAWNAADTSEREGDSSRAVDHARRACELELDEEAGWRRLMLLQDRLGDRAGALRSYTELVERLEREFGARPSPETVAVAQSIRSSNRTVAAPPRAAESSASLPPTPELIESAPMVMETAPMPVRSRTASRYLTPVLLALFAILAGFAALRASRQDRRDPQSLIATGTLSSRDRIVVADFVNQAGDSALAAVITQAVRVDLPQSPLVRVLSTRELQSALVRMQRPPTTFIDDSVARDIALREGAKAILVGAVGKVGSAYTVSAQLVSTDRGESLVSVRETATDSTQLIAAVDRVSKALRYKIGESLRDLRSSPPLRDATTPSLPALRKYTEGYSLFLAGRRTEAIRLMEQAVAIDTGFSMAWRAIASTYGAMAEPGRAFAAGRHAFANKDRLPFKERAFLVAGEAYGSGNYETAIRAYESYLERYPGDAAALSNMALAYRDWRRYPQAESLYTRAIAADSTIAIIYYGLHSVQADQGKFADSRHTLDEIARRFPNNGTLPTVEMQDAAARQSWDEAERRAEANIAARQGDTLSLVDPFEAMAGIVETRGRLAEADKYWRTQLRLSAASKSSARHLFGVQQLAMIDLRYHNERARARATMDSALRRTPLDSILPADRPYYELARFYAEVGDLSRARSLLAAGDQNDRLVGRDRPAERSWTRGVIALAVGQPRDAELELRQADETHTCPICVLPDLARAYEAVGNMQSALVTYARYTETPWLWRYETDATDLGFALKRMGELYAEAGDNEKSATAYAKLLRLWQRADPELQSVLADVRKRIPTTGK